MQDIPHYRLIGSPFLPTARGKRQKYYCQRYRLLNDPVRKIRTVSLKTWQIGEARKLMRQTVEKAIAPQPELAGPQTLAEHLTTFQAHKRSQRISEKQVIEQRQRIEAICNGCGFRSIHDIKQLPIDSWLAAQRSRKVKPHSVRTSIHHVAAIRCFTRWLATHSRLHRDPLMSMPRSVGSGEAPPTFERRALSDNELCLLLANARKSTAIVHGLTGQQRAYIYLLGAYSGFRAGELASLTPESFDLDGADPCVTIACTISKRRRTDRQIIPLDVAKQLRPMLVGQPSGQRLWRGKWFRKAAEMVRLDLQGLNLDQRDGVVDFHSLRHSFITRLGQTQASDREIMEVGRLSCSSLVKRYCHFSDAARAKIVGRLQVPKLKLA